MDQQRLSGNQPWRGQKQGESTLTAVGEEPGWLRSSDRLVFKGDWQQRPVESGVGPQRRAIPVVLLAFRQQVADLPLQLRTDGVLGQNQNAQTGRVVLHHVQENLHREDQNIWRPEATMPLEQLMN